MKKFAAALLALGVFAWTGITVVAADVQAAHGRSAGDILTGFGGTKWEWHTAEPGSETDGENGKGVSVANPFTDCENLNEARAAAGFDMTAPEAVGIYDKTSYTAIKGQLLQIQYAADEERYICVRKAAGSGDISGDYNVYAKELRKTVGTKTVVMKGNGGQVSLATWTEGGYTYSVGIYDTGICNIDGAKDAGLFVDEMIQIIAQIQ